MRKINILYVIGQLGIGGAEKQALELIKGIDKRKFNVILCCLNNNSIDLAKELEKYCKVIILKKILPIDFTRIPRLIKIIRKYKIDIVHNDLSTANIWGTIAGKIEKKKVIVCLEVLPPYRRYDLVIDKAITLFADKIITYSKTNMEFFRKKLDFDKKKGCILYNGVDLKRFYVKRVKYIKKDFIVGIVANLSKVKNHQMFLKAAKLVLDKFPKTKFWIIGDGPEKKRLVELSKKLIINKNIVFFGLISNIPKILGKMDIFAMTSYSEGLPNALMEAMASGLPVVATNVGGIPELISDGEEGFLVETGDYKGLADKLIILIKKRKLNYVMGKKAKQKIKQFSIDKKVKNLQQIYIDLAEKHLKH